MNNISQGRLIFCSGGCRSGKSARALALAEAGGAAFPGRGGPVFVATLEARDPEMRARAELHRLERGPAWRTLEIPMASAPDLPRRLAQALEMGRVLVLDCLSAWVGACMETLASRHAGGRELETDILARFSLALDRLAGSDALCVLVSSEAGLGLVPDSAAGRLFRDILGRVNQAAAARSDEAWFMVSGLPLRLK